MLGLCHACQRSRKTLATAIISATIATGTSTFTVQSAIRRKSRVAAPSICSVSSPEIGAPMEPRLLVLSSLFPSAAEPNAGLFIRERMFRVGRMRPVVVVAPQPWFPGQWLIRRFRPHFRRMAPTVENMDGIEIRRPRFFSVPGRFKRFDGFLMALGSALTVRRLVRERSINVIDAHFGYPDGYAGRCLARWFRLPMVLTLRGKEAPLRSARPHWQRALPDALP